MDAPLRFDPTRLADELERSLAWLDWACEGLAPGHEDLGVDGGWSVRRNLSHLVAYEERLAAPALEDLAAGGDAGSLVRALGGSEWPALEAELSQSQVSALTSRLRAARKRQVQACGRFTSASFNEPSCVLWGLRDGSRHAPGWVAAKTVQHTWEHGTPILKVVSFAPR